MHLAGDISPSDEVLMAKVCQGDRDSLRILHDRYRELVHTIALSVCRQPCDAEAVLVSVFWEIWEKPDRWNPDRGSMRTFLLLLSRSRARDLMRSESIHISKLKEFHEDLTQRKYAEQASKDPSQQVCQTQQAARVRLVCEILSSETAEVVQMAFFDGLTHPEIAEKLKLPLGTVKTRIRRGLSQLREHVQAKQEDWFVP